MSQYEPVYTREYVDKLVEDLRNRVLVRQIIQQTNKGNIVLQILEIHETLSGTVIIVR